MKPARINQAHPNECNTKKIDRTPIKIQALIKSEMNLQPSYSELYIVKWLRDKRSSKTQYHLPSLKKRTKHNEDAIRVKRTGFNWN